MKGVIENRFKCNFKDISLTLPYDLVISRWALCYLPEDDLRAFLKRSHNDLLKDRPEGKPGVMIFFETILEDDER